MSILEINRGILNSMYQRNPNSVSDLKLEGNYLVYKDEMVDISNFNLNELIYGDSQFASSIDSLNSEDVFKIIRLHALIMGDGKLKKVEEEKPEKRIETIKEENPLMKNISLVSRPNGVGTDEFINIVDSKGENHLFKNETEVNIFNIYDRLKAAKEDAVTPDELIHEINSKLYEINMTKADKTIESSSTSEDFANKMTRVSDPYKGNNTVNITGNEQEDIAIVSDLSDSHNTQIKTFGNDNGDLVINSHGQNVNEVNTTQVNGTESSVIESDTTVKDKTDTSREVNKNEKKDEVIRLIPFEEFKKLFNPTYTTDFSPEERKQVDLYYAFFGDLILYEDYLLPELREILGKLRAFVTEIEISQEESQVQTPRQREIIQKRVELEDKGKNKEISTDLDKEQEYVKKLMYQKPNENGNVSTLQVVMFVIIIIALLSLISLYILN